MKHRWAMFVVGAWLAGTVLVATVAAENFYTIDRLLAGSSSAAFHASVARLGQPEARDLLRYLSSELNRLYFQLWNPAQIALGVFAWWLVGGNRSPRGVRLGLMSLLLLAGVTIALTPEIVSVGRSLDFVPHDPAPPNLQRFWILHGLYTSLEMLKLLIGAFVAGWIARAEPARASGRAAA